MFARGSKSPNTEAAEWMVLLDGEDMSAKAQDRFREWVADPQNARALDSTGTVVNMVKDLPLDYKSELEQTLPPSTGRFGVARRLLLQPIWLGAVAVACSAVLALVFIGWHARLGPGVVRPWMVGFSHSYTSNIGEVRTITLPDGSAATLNTQTTLKWIGTDHERRVQLLSGEALFEIEHDPSRPFQIDLPGHSVIRVLGTRFDVYVKSSGKIRVTVLNGTVAIEGGRGTLHETLTANQQIEYSPDDPVAQVRIVDAPRAIGWRDGVLEVSEQPLSDVVNELGRYTSKQIIVDPELQSRPISGVFPVRDVPNALTHIERAVPITVTQTDTAFILNHRPDAPAGEANR